MNNEELKEYLASNFSELLPPTGGHFQLKFKPDFYIKKVLPVFLEKNFTGLKKMLENDSKISMGYIGHFPPRPKIKDDGITKEELKDYYNKLELASNAFSKNPSDPVVEKLLITIDKQLKMLEEILI